MPEASTVATQKKSRQSKDGIDYLEQNTESWQMRDNQGWMLSGHVMAESCNRS